MTDTFRKKEIIGIIHALTVARDHLTFLSGLHANDNDNPLKKNDAIRIERCIETIIDLRREFIGYLDD